MAHEFTDANFKTEVLDSDKLTVIDFWAEWCGPCRAIGPVIEELSKEYEGKVNIGKVNVDHNPQVSMNYGITSIPAILFVKGGQVVDKLVGAQPKANFVKKIELQFVVNNIFNDQYETDAWVYRYMSKDAYNKDTYYNEDGYFPQAGRNFMAAVVLSF